jgi:type VI secretion system protein ImpL
VPTTITWPGSKGTNQVRLQLLPPGAGASGIVEEGPWALHRLLGRARLAPGSSPERFTAELTVGGRSATFEVYVGSVLNPFRLPELEQFNCPGRL